MARTRATKGTAAAAADKSATAKSCSAYILPTASDNPSKLFILPKTATPQARIVTLQNPRYNKPTRYLVCPSAGIFEFTKIAAPKSDPRSWLIQPQPSTTAAATETEQPATTQTAQSPTLHLATPLDPLFLLLPALCPHPSDTAAQAQQKGRLFLSPDDHLDALPDPARHLAEILSTSPATRALLEARLAAVCDVVAAGDEKMYRAPVVGVRVARGAAGGGLVDGGVESQASATSVETAASAASAASTAATSVAHEDGVAACAMAASEEVVRLQRLRVAFDFICSSYVAPPVAVMLKANLAKATDLVDFKPLDEYLARLTKLRQDAAAVRTTDYSRKRAGDEDEDERAEKKRKKEAEEKVKKANQSRGVKSLAKVNTSGMKKMSDFFKKKA
ncbi:hypothetical protein BT67DRAFT_458372 [Trichocladium antarcticum]|uniref:Ribonuclease H2 subunit B n=1 Tax=Trichocladium antarcticum TaxID=1450529 RepID=A0AAN6UE46_9PEZI|nr:hypothetical protein BT67DRAFT_458372 [Trichocladium antarcticum]